MKLTFRDKAFIMVLIVALIIGGGFSMFIRPKFDEIKSAKEDYESVQEELKTVKERVEKEKNLLTEIDTAYKTGESIAETFFQEMEPQKFDEYIKGILDDEGIFIDGMNISDLTIMSVDYYTYEPIHFTYPLYEAADINGTNPQIAATAVPQGESLAAYTIDFNWSADRDDICKFMDKILIAEKISLRIDTIDFQEIDEEDENGVEYDAVLAEGESKDNAMPIREYAGSCKMTMFFMEPIAEIDESVLN